MIDQFCYTLVHSTHNTGAVDLVEIWIDCCRLRSGYTLENFVLTFSMSFLHLSSNQCGINSSLMIRKNFFDWECNESLRQLLNFDIHIKQGVKCVLKSKSLIAQLEEHQTYTQKVKCSSLLRAEFVLNIICNMQI